MAYKVANTAVGKAQFKVKTGVDLTDEEYLEYARRLNKKTAPFAIPLIIFVIIGLLVFFNMVGVFDSPYPTSYWVGIFVFCIVMACGPCIGMGISQTVYMKKYAAEITAKRQQAMGAEQERQHQLDLQRQAEAEQKRQLDQQKNAMMETTRMDKLKKLVKVSEKLKISQMAQILAMDETTLYDRIVDWADKYGFTLDEDVVKFGGGRKDEFIAALDGAFQGWDKKTQTKDGKLE
jgi:hypothetical protein